MKKIWHYITIVANILCFFCGHRPANKEEQELEDDFTKDPES